MYWPAGPKKVRAVFNEGPNRVLSKKLFFRWQLFFKGGTNGKLFFIGQRKRNGELF